MTPKERAAMQQALEALETDEQWGFVNKKVLERRLPAITALREALAEQAECPHGVDDGACKECYMEQTDYFDYGLEEVEDYLRNCCNNNFMADKLSDIRKSIYAAPVRTKDLTDDEILPDGYGVVTTYDGLLEFARAVIAADRGLNK